MVIYTADGRREVRARKQYTCEHCEGVILRKELHWNYHSENIPGNWRGRQHLDCQAAWWQGETLSMLSAVSSLPRKNPPDIERFRMPFEIGTVVDFGATGKINLYTPQGYCARLMFGPKPAVAKEAVDQIEAALQLCFDSLMAVSGNKKKSTQLSNILQQMALVSGLEPQPRGDK